MIEHELACAAEDRIKAKKELEEASSIKRALRSLAAEFEQLMHPIREFAKRFEKASPLVRQAIGLKGLEAARMVESDDVRMIEAMIGRTGGLAR